MACAGRDGRSALESVARGRLLSGAFLIYWRIGSSGGARRVSAEKTGSRRTSSEFKPAAVVLDLVDYYYA